MVAEWPLRRAFPVVFPQTPLSDAYAVEVIGGGRDTRIICMMPANRFRGAATSAIWEAINRPWPTTMAPVLISFSGSVFISYGVEGERVRGVLRQERRLDPLAAC